ncbi:hypothetical protein E0H73_11055 [Kribbella pittospori]|uniref:Uncharacterized protein n=1 Tax=Kribbella pittospori TaxID=722689 RepID=A0A4R0KUW0_9ACTN|nr:hypothetical protein [Kribbella pittospori]TCC63016.1 hypothetical protein E0H73_11055 [Kribbella pittospori]
MEFAIFVVIMIIVSLVAKAKQQSKTRGTPNPRVQAVINRIQAEVQKNGGPPLELGPKYAQYAQPAPPQQYQPPAPYPQIQFQQRQKAPRQDVDTRVRELMTAGHEVGAVRLLSDELDMGLLEAQEYARNLVAPAGAKPTGTANKPAQNKPAQSKPAPEIPEPGADEDTRYVGSAAFAESIFDLDRDEETWSSGWVDKPEPDDRSDIDELWETVRNAARPGTTPAS